ncbi:type IV pilus assembly protein PilY1 [Janthinobacterium sp. CG_23.3]|uniref:pilus assembly protein n=1 Tax=Janthinobacterium sp. CG_23.3 TaxID=3349634 RepID=UPI0038D3600B
MTHSLIQGVLATALLALPLATSATDLDLYTNLGSTVAADLPNVLFIIDNTANWNNAFTNEMAALANTLHNLPVNKFNIGIMLATESGGGNGGQAGGYVRAAIRTMNGANKLKYEALVNSFDKLADKGNSGASGVSMAEAYAYFSGGAAYSGNQKTKTDYLGNVGGTSQSTAIYALGGNALSSFGAANYLSPVASGSCAKNYIIYISNGPNQESSSKDTIANGLLSSAAGGGTAGTNAVAQIPISPSGSQSNPSDEWARFMKKSTFQIVTYSIDVDPGASGQGPGWTALLKSMSGLSNYTAVSSVGGSAAIASSINDALSKIQSVNSVFAAVSLPASANVQGAYLNQLYVGMFRPDPDSKPRWMGNLKQYQLGAASTLVDADSAPAINTQTGFISECARSYWTPSKSSPDAYWVNDPKGKCIPPPGSAADLYAQSNSPDGNIVEKGAAGYVLRAQSAASRVVKTCSATNCNALLDFNSTNVSTAALGAADSAERDTLIQWARGQNVDGDLSKTTTEMRPSAHSDVIHSNPLALSYGSNVVVFYGSNDGMLHAINGNQTAANGSADAGAELWAFMPPEFIGNVKRLRNNSPNVSVTPPVGGVVSGSAKPFGIDGPISAYKTGATTWIYAGMRRGGRAVYSFDVSIAASPSLKWKGGCSGSADTSCTTGTAGMGQTWSSPQPVRASGYFGGAAPMLIMGGGYDECEDADQNTCTSASKGHKIYVLDAATGAVLVSLNTDRGVVGDVKIVPGPGGYAKYAYAADLGGNIYRVTIDTLAPASWTILKIASLGCGTAASCTDNRKFMFAPSVVPESDGSYSLYVGSGDREKPLGGAYFPHTSAVVDYFFKIKDKPSDTGWLPAEAAVNCPGQSLICLNSLTSAGTASGTCGLGAGGVATGKGWMLGLRATEKVVTPASTRFGVTTFSTHMPAVPVAGSCASNLGTTHVYNLGVTDAAPTPGTTCNAVVTGGGLPPPPEKIDVCINRDCTTKKSICIGCSTESSIQSQENGVPSGLIKSNSKRRVYWYLQK